MGWTSDMDLVVFNTYVYFSHDEKRLLIIKLSMV
jgi:hypothetical protein